MSKKKQSVVLSIRLGETSLEAVDLLVNSGLETNRSRAVSHFITKGIQSSAEMLLRAKHIADHIHQLKAEMIEAVKFNNLEKVTALIDQNSDLVNAKSSSGETAVLLAAYYRANEIKELLIEQGADLNIFEAAAVGKTTRVKELLETTSEELVNAYSMDGFTPLGLAAHFGSEETVRLLLDKGASVNARSTDGNLNNMAIHAAIAGNYEQIVRILILHGADVNAECKGKWRLGYTPLHVAAYFGRSSIIEILLQNAAAPSKLTENNESPYDLAILRDHPEEAALLKKSERGE
jgi:ankyrin repeat protein